MSSVLGIDTTFNLFKLWVTDSCYENYHLVNPRTREHPTFLGPSLFHFTNDDNTFSGFCIELLGCDQEVAGLKKVGVDMEDAIFNGVEAVFPKVGKLYCVRHLKQQDEAKLIKLLAKITCPEALRLKSKREILDNIYGVRQSNLYEYGLCKSTNKEEFLVKLTSLELKWNSLCAGFYDWFLKHRKEKFLTSVIRSAREGANVAGLYYQNSIESQHFVEKVQQNFEKATSTEAILNFRDIIIRQDNEEIRALYEGGNYRYLI